MLVCDGMVEEAVMFKNNHEKCHDFVIFWSFLPLLPVAKICFFLAISLISHLFN